MKNKLFNVKSLKNDIFSGVIVALVSIPISMGYAQIAGLPAVYGLYGSVLPILTYAFLSSSPQFVVGVDAMPAAMTGSLLSELGIAAASREALLIIPAISVLTALWLLLFRLIHAGRLVRFISSSVMSGFISGVAVTIILMQVPKLFGGNAGTGEVADLILNIINEHNSFNAISLILGLSTVTLILVGKKFIPKVPVSVVILILSMFATRLFNIEEFGVKLLPQVEKSLPRFVIPDMRVLLPHLSSYLILSLTIAAVIMAQTILAASSYASKYDYKLDVNRETLAYAAMNAASAISGCCPINGSVSRSGIADQFGTKSQTMSITASFSMLNIILFCTKLFVLLPVPVLTGIVISALIGIIDFKSAVRFWKCDKTEFIIFIAALAGVLFLGTINGVFLGVFLSFLAVIRKNLNPPKAFLGKIPGQHGYYDLSRNSNSVAIKNTIIYRFNGNLFFANIKTFEEDILNSIKPDTKQVIIDAGGIGNVDITAADRLIYIETKLRKKGIKFYITEHQGPVNDLLIKYGASSLIKNGNIKRTISIALKECGMEKPYPLEDGSTSHPTDHTEEMHSDTKKLAEHEWVFGNKNAE